MFGESQSTNSVHRPVSLACVEQFGGGGYAIFIISHSCQVITEKIRHEQQLVGNFQLYILTLLHAVELE